MSVKVVIGATGDPSPLGDCYKQASRLGIGIKHLHPVEGKAFHSLLLQNFLLFLLNYGEFPHLTEHCKLHSYSILVCMMGSVHVSAVD